MKKKMSRMLHLHYPYWKASHGATKEVSEKHFFLTSLLRDNSRNIIQLPSVTKFYVISLPASMQSPLALASIKYSEGRPCVEYFKGTERRLKSKLGIYFYEDFFDAKSITMLDFAFMLSL
jgi:hypothetical protein